MRGHFLLVSWLLVYLAPRLNDAEDTPHHKCSHRPPPPGERLEHIWVNDANFSASEDNFKEDPNHIPNTKHMPAEANAIKTKRQIAAGLKDTYARHLESSMLDSVWNGVLATPPKRARQLAGSSGQLDELVPMRIQVHYDSSVHQLEAAKFRLIVNIVMPAVIEFFEGVLLLKRDDMIERFRMERRCPNNTIYYATNPLGGSKAYCKDRCEDWAICGEMEVPRAHLSACSYCNSTSRKCLTDHRSAGKGVANGQLLLYVSANQTRRCSRDQTIAYAAHCAQDPRTDRPIAGHANLCPASISTDLKDLKALIATVKHELTHVLGFSVSLFAYYRDRFGTPLTERPPTPGPIPVDPRTGYAQWSDRVIRRYVRKGWSTGGGKIDRVVHVMITPTVVKEVRSHFNCSALEGAELEDQGSEGTSLTHWEKRLFENEAMTGTHTQNSVYSRLTLAALQDTGWYLANFSRADKLEWGKDLGCDFAKQSCKSWIDERRARGESIRPFCDGVKESVVRISCTEDRRSKAVCNMKHYPEPLPGLHQNFDSLEGVPRHKLAHYGGSVDLADYCPFIQEFTWHSQNTSYRSSGCELAEPATAHHLSTETGAAPSQDGSERSAALEHYGPQSRCFEHGGKWEQRTCVYRRVWHHFGAGCYRFACQPSGHLSVTVGNYTYNCYYAGQRLQVEQLANRWFYNGTLICPACEQLCGAPNCVHYERHLIDRMLSLEASAPAEASLDYVSRLVMDELMNSIESETGAKFKAAPAAGAANFTPLQWPPLSGQLEGQVTLMEKYLSLLPLNGGPESPGRDTLICSAAAGPAQLWAPLIGAALFMPLQYLSAHRQVTLACHR